MSCMYSIFPNRPFMKTFFSINKLPALCLIFLFSGAMFSCTSSKKLKYFSNLADSPLVRLPIMPVPQAEIATDDLLEIRISGANEATTAIINNYSNTAGSTNAFAYLVDKNGEVEFPILGKVKAAGLTKDMFRDKLKGLVTKYLKDPVVVVKFTNFRFTVLGEVKAPGTFSVPLENVTILDALGSSGDMTSFARRNNVRVIREVQGTRIIGTVNFQEKAVFTSPFFYLQRNDVIYVEPETTKSKIDDISRIISIAATLIGVLAVVLTIKK